MGNFDPARIVNIQTAKILDDMERSNKIDELYDLIKQKRDNAQWERNMQSPSDPDVDPYDLIALEGQINAYNDVLSLIESMFEVTR